jgi:hypothetical protein
MLAQLKQRLESLPARRRVAQQGELFSRFCERAKAAKQNAQEAAKAAANAKLAFNEFDDKETIARAKQAGRRAQRLYKKLKENPETVSDASVEESIAALSSQALSALAECRRAWGSLLSSKLSGRSTLADVVAKVLPRHGAELRQTVSDLQTAAARPPVEKAQAERVRKSVDHFDTLLNKVGLTDEVGTFLKDVAGPNGARIKSLENQTVRDFLDEHKLWPIFRVRLQ